MCSCKSGYSAAGLCCHENQQLLCGEPDLSILDRDLVHHDFLLLDCDCRSLNNSSQVQQSPLIYIFFQVHEHKSETAFTGSLDTSSSLLARFSNTFEKLYLQPEPSTVRWDAHVFTFVSFLALCCCCSSPMNSFICWFHMCDSPNLWHDVKTPLPLEWQKCKLLMEKSLKVPEPKLRSVKSDERDLI